MTKVRLVRNAEQEELEELNNLCLEGLASLKENNLPNNVLNGKEVVTSLRHFIDLYRGKKIPQKIEESEKVMLAYGMGEIYAKAVINTYNWNYVFIEEGNSDDDFEGFAVVSPDKKWCIHVHNYFYSLLYDEKKSNNSLLTFNMLEPKTLQEYKSDGYQSMG